MKTTVIIGGNNQETEEIRVKEYPSGKRIVESGDAQNIIKGEKPKKEFEAKVTVQERKKLRKNPNDFNLEGNRLVPKKKNK